MASLYELTGKWLALQEIFGDYYEDEPEEARAVMVENALEAIDELEGSIEEKVTNITRMIRNLTAEGEAYDAEVKRLSAKKKLCENSVERLKGYLYDSMNALNVRRFDTSIGTWRIQSNPPSVKIVDAEKIPAKYRVPQPDKIDRAAILKDHRATGEIIEGTDIVYGLGLRFK